MYPSDYGYTTSNTYWNTMLTSYYDAANTSWLYKIANYNDSEWLISPSSSSSSKVYAIYVMGEAGGSQDANSYLKCRPVVNIISTARILDNGADGSSTNPYVIV